jgi:hypothetical protein
VQGAVCATLCWLWWLSEALALRLRMPYKCVRSATQQIGRVPNNPLLGGARCATADASSSTQLCIFRSGMEHMETLPTQYYPGVSKCSFFIFHWTSNQVLTWRPGVYCEVLYQLYHWGLLNGVRSAFVKWLKGDRDDFLFVLVFLIGTGPLCSQARFLLFSMLGSNLQFLGDPTFRTQPW